MGQNNDTTERGDAQGQQGGDIPLTPEERKRQSRYPEVPGTKHDLDPAEAPTRTMPVYRGRAR